MLDWKLRKSEIKNLKRENETTGRLNRNLLNNLTINAEKQTDIKIVGRLKQSNFIKTRYLWNHWITSIPGIGFINLASCEFYFQYFYQRARKTSSNLRNRIYDNEAESRPKQGRKKTKYGLLVDQHFLCFNANSYHDILLLRLVFKLTSLDDALTKVKRV